MRVIETSEDGKVEEVLYNNVDSDEDDIIYKTVLVAAHKYRGKDDVPAHERVGYTKFNGDW